MISVEQKGQDSHDVHLGAVLGDVTFDRHIQVNTHVNL